MSWTKIPLQERIAVGYKFMDEFKKMKDEISMELALQMGRPIAQNAGEVRGLLERSEYMLSIAESSLADVQLPEKPGFRRFIKRTPIGVVLVIYPWNFPFLVSINSVLPAIIAGNSVLLKPSPQTPLTADRLLQAFTRAGLPNGVLQVLNLSPELTKQTVQHPLVNFISFTGSVGGGKAIETIAADSQHFKGVALELGGKDPAYVRTDADLPYTVNELVDGSFFNSGQSCCAVERIYVHNSIFEPFVALFVEAVKKYKLGDPTDPNTNLGPVVSVASAERIKKQVIDAVQAGAKPLIPEELFATFAKPGTAFVAPQVLVNVNHSMEVMMEETFGPVVGILSVSSDEEALKMMNDSPYGLTGSVWTNAENPESEKAFLQIVDGLETGTVFLNRCDYLDPALAWTGVKNSGRGVSLSKYGYDQLTRAKSVHMKMKTS
ncbi:succinate semialdehyde dehydrogenase [Rickenella mellea]|uniref:Succinate semialdehyde dehydrogenase n=1 Tax=Rickenella mellea TaxID=50990 RepID=A0A4Y7PM37_9AGAM|nr:succinate semialdehyde dehydrogenase [Rickenella mellea]